MKSIFEKYKGKVLKIFLKNSMKYEGKVLEVSDDGFLLIDDKVKGEKGIAISEISDYDIIKGDSNE